MKVVSNNDNRNLNYFIPHGIEFNKDKQEYCKSNH